MSDSKTQNFNINNSNIPQYARLFANKCLQITKAKLYRRSFVSEKISKLKQKIATGKKFDEKKCESLGTDKEDTIQLSSPVVSPIDYLDRLKTYYQINKQKMTQGIDTFRKFYQKRKAIKGDFRDMKILARNCIISVFLFANVIFVYKKRKSADLLSQIYKFFYFSGIISGITNAFVQNRINNYYRKEIKKLDSESNVFVNDKVQI